MDEYAMEYRQLSTVHMEYGGMVAPFMLGGEWSALTDFASSVVASPPTDEVGRRAIEKRFDEFLENPAFHPNYRAHLAYRSISLPHLCKCSHLIERAILHYYKSDFLSCVLVLLPAVEGVLRSYAAWTFGSPDPKPSDVRDMLRGTVADSYPDRRLAYAEALCAFHERWFWKHSTQADFRLSHLNRHYALHSLGTESFYRPIDCHRLFLYFDTFADMLMLEGHGPAHVFLPLEESGVARRSEYYFSLLLEPPNTHEATEFETALLREHPHFVSASKPPNVFEIFERFDQIMGVR